MNRELTSTAAQGLAAMGFSSARAMAGEAAESLLRRADVALYAAKKGGRNRSEPAAAALVAA
jgi:PleD family two-component response regulator